MLEKTEDEQRKSLQVLLDFATSPVAGNCNFGAMVLLSPRGDVSFLAPIAPELRGVEIVSASPTRADGRNYDIWKRTGNPSKFWIRITPTLTEHDLTAAEVVMWLNKQCKHSEIDYMQNGAKWLENVFHFYQIPKRREINDRRT